MKVTLLGVGGSTGVPSIGGVDGSGDWGGCDPQEPRNRRVEITCKQRVRIGAKCAISWDVLITDTDYHRLDGAEDTVIAWSAGGNDRKIKGNDYVQQFALPNFFFFVTTAYDILRHRGVPVGKRDFLGPVNWL